MRHSSIDLTMNVYTDPKLLDVQGALDALPALPLTSPPAQQNQNLATGTDGFTPHSEHPSKFGCTPVAPTAGQLSPKLSPAVNLGSLTAGNENLTDIAVSGITVNEIRPLSHTDNGRHKVGATGFEPATSTSRTSTARVVSESIKGLTANANFDCTPVAPMSLKLHQDSTEEPEADNAQHGNKTTTPNCAMSQPASISTPSTLQNEDDTLLAIAIQIAGLSAEQKSKLVAMLLQSNK